VKTYDDCNYCGGKVTEKLVPKDCWWGDKLIAVINHVPAGVCEQCGEKYFRANVLKKVESLLKEKKKLNRKVCIPVGEFAKV